MSDATYRLNFIKLTNKFEQIVEISDLLVNMNIFEDLFSNTMTGNIQITDSIGLIESMPIIGEETLEISFTIDDRNEYYHKFSVVCLKDLNQTAQDTQTYLLELVSPEAIKNISTRIQTFYDGKSSDTVKNICNNMLDIDDLFVEDSLHTKEIVVPNWNPFKVINYLASNSVVPNTSNIESNFIFYENRDKFCFTSIHKMFEQEPVAEFYFNGRIIENSVNNSNLMVVNDYSFKKCFDRLENIKNGMYNNRLYTYDIINKQYDFKDFSYNNHFKQSKHVEHNAVSFTEFEHDPRAKSIFLPTNEDSHLSHTYDLTSQNRLSQMQQLDNYKLILNCKGEPFSTVGEIIDFNTPSIRYADYDSLIAGKFLITKKRHILGRTLYSTILECQKDCFRG